MIGLGFRVSGLIAQLLASVELLRFTAHKFVSHHSHGDAAAALKHAIPRILTTMRKEGVTKLLGHSNG